MKVIYVAMCLHGYIFHGYGLNVFYNYLIYESPHSMTPFISGLITVFIQYRKIYHYNENTCPKDRLNGLRYVLLESIGIRCRPKARCKG